MNNPTVSVCLSVENCAKHVAQALDSILRQECDFNYEIVVGDNCSTDETVSILEQYQQTHPNKFTLLLHKTKLGHMNHNLYTWEACKGKYIALLGCDDYWEDPLKLQKQVDFLEKNAEFSACYHDTIIVDDNDDLILETFGHNRDYSEDEQLCGMATMQLSTRMIRNMAITLPEYMRDLKQFDTIVGHFSGFHGKSKYLLSIEKSIYRFSKRSYASKQNRLQINIETREAIMEHIGNESTYRETIKQFIKTMYADTLYVTLRDEGFKNYIELWKIIGTSKYLGRSEIFLAHLKDTMYKIKRKVRKVFEI